MKKPLSSLDLNLLLCLQLLTQELSVTRTAKRMNVSPSAVSKSLAKLRAWFDDPLFVKTPLGLAPTPLVSSMEQDLADWMQMGNQILDKPHHTMPSGLKFELAAEAPLLMILFNTLSQRIYQRYPQALIRLRNWDYDSLDAIIRGEVDIGFCGRESHPQSRSLLAELLFMLYGISELPEIINEANGRPVFSDRQLPRFSIAYTGNIVGVALTTEGDCGLDMELQRTVRSHDADRHNFSNNENLWINIQHDPDEARSQLVALRRSVLKLTGEASTQLQLLPGSGRLRTAGSQPIEAVCDAESLLVWSIAATPNIGSLKVWEYDAKGGDWRSLADAQQRAREPSARLMRFTSLPMEKTLSLN